MVISVLIILLIWTVIIPSVQLQEQKANIEVISNVEYMYNDYSFYYKDKTWNIHANIPKNILEESIEKTNNIRDARLLLQPKLVKNMFSEDEYMEEIYNEIRKQSFGISDEEIYEIVIYFIQTQIEYCSDEENYNALEYFALPWETLISGKGDCEDKAMLLAAILRAGNKEAKVIVTKDHCLVAMVGKKPYIKKEYNLFTKETTIISNGYKYIYPNEIVTDVAIKYNGQTYYLLESTIYAPLGCVDEIVYENVKENYEIY